MESFFIRNVVNDDGGLGAPIVHGRERVVALLARRVPDLELDGGVVDLDCLREEGGADGALLELVELALDEAQHQARLAHRGLAQKHQLELAGLVGSDSACACTHFVGWNWLALGK